jgi:hypothetical protein
MLATSLEKTTWVEGGEAIGKKAAGRGEAFVEQLGQRDIHSKHKDRWKSDVGRRYTCIRADNNVQDPKDPAFIMFAIYPAFQRILADDQVCSRPPSLPIL